MSSKQGFRPALPSLFIYRLHTLSVLCPLCTWQPSLFHLNSVISTVVGLLQPKGLEDDVCIDEAIQVMSIRNNK